MDHLLEAAQICRARGGTLPSLSASRDHKHILSLVMELRQEVCCGAGCFCRKGLKEPTHTWSWPSGRGGIAGKTPFVGGE